MDGVGLRDYLFQQTSISQSQDYKLGFVEKNDIELYYKVLKEEISISKVFLNLKKYNDMT